MSDTISKRRPRVSPPRLGPDARMPGTVNLRIPAIYVRTKVTNKAHPNSESSPYVGPKSRHPKNAVVAFAGVRVTAEESARERRLHREAQKAKCKRSKKPVTIPISQAPKKSKFRTFAR